MGNKQPKKQQPEETASDKLFETIWEFKMQARELAKQSKKSELEKDQKIKSVKLAIENNRPEAAKLAATDAIRKANEAKRYLNLSYKVEAIHGKLKTAYQTQKLNENMQNMTQKMGQALGAMDLVKVNENISTFEKMFDNLDVNAELMDKAMDNIDAGSYAEKDVNNLITQVAQVNNLKMQNEFADIKNEADVQKDVDKNKILDIVK